MPSPTHPLVLWSLTYASLASNWLRLLNTEQHYKECQQTTQDPEEPAVLQENKLAPCSWLVSTARDKWVKKKSKSDQLPLMRMRNL